MGGGHQKQRRRKFGAPLCVDEAPRRCLATARHGGRGGEGYGSDGTGLFWHSRSWKSRRMPRLTSLRTICDMRVADRVAPEKPAPLRPAASTYQRALLRGEKQCLLQSNSNEPVAAQRASRLATCRVRQSKADTGNRSKLCRTL